ncbi:hypothetical protein JOM56_013091, partial [Amanita muscaria]
MGKDALMNLILLVLLLFRRQDHSFSSNTIYTSASINISMSHSRASRDEQVLFFVLRFRQIQGHRPPPEASSLAPSMFVDTHMQQPETGYGSKSEPVLLKRRIFERWW